jgi:hypothetical protein
METIMWEIAFLRTVKNNRMWQDTVLQRDGIYLAEKFYDGNKMIDVNL